MCNCKQPCFPNPTYKYLKYIIIYGIQNLLTIKKYIQACSSNMGVLYPNKGGQQSIAEDIHVNAIQH